MLGDLYTKNLAGPRHQYLVQRIGNHTDPALASKLTKPVGSTATAGVHAFSTDQRIDDKQPFFDEYFAEKPFLELADSYSTPIKKLQKLDIQKLRAAGS